MSDIVERLQNQAMKRMFRSEELSDGTMIWFPIMREAADTIEALRTENAELREALEDMINLAEAADVMDDPAYDAARKALGETE